jgi:ABC-type transporter Mla maintaining outer membrane lipid asymmetry permease subunit MlaE
LIKIKEYLVSNRFKTFVKIEMICLVGLLVAAALCAGIVFIRDILEQARSSISPTESAWWSFLIIMSTGLVPTILFAAPLYSLLRAYGYARWKWVLTISVLPGLLFCFIELYVGVYVLICGLTIAIITHLYFQKR